MVETRDSWSRRAKGDVYLSPCPPPASPLPTHRAIRYVSRSASLGYSTQPGSPLSRTAPPRIGFIQYCTLVRSPPSLPIPDNNDRDLHPGRSFLAATLASQEPEDSRRLLEGPPHWTAVCLLIHQHIPPSYPPSDSTPSNRR